MKTITFHNETTLDPKAFQIMGLSVKEDNAIGMFGTGMKYAIATTLRLGDKIEIISAGKTYSFSTRKDEFRGEPVEIVQCNGQDLNFTTQLGKLWEPWMAYREFFCNALDEGGSVCEGKSDATTQVIITGEVLANIHSKQDAYFLVNRTPIWKSDTLEIYSGQTSQAFYKGVCVGEISNVANYTYNILSNLELTEDRTMKYGFYFKEKIGTAFAACTDKELIKSILGAKGFEKRINYGLAKEVSPEFLAVVEDNYKKHHRLPSGFADKFKELCADLLVPEKLEMTDRQDRQIRKAKAFLAKAGYKIENPIYLIESSGDSLYGQAKDGEIWLTQKAFEHGQFDLCATLLEEWMHNEKGYQDYTREMQDWLFRQIMIQAEERFDEIL